MPPEVTDDTEKVLDQETETPSGESKEESTEEVEGKKSEATDKKEVDDTKEVDETKVTDAQERIQNILDEAGVDSLEDFLEKYKSLSELEAEIGPHDLKQLIEDSEYLSKVKEFWKDQEEEKKREGETDAETIERLEREKKDAEDKLKDRDKKDAKRKEDIKKAEEAKKLIKSFNITVVDEIDKTKDFPKEYKSFAKKYLGVDNPANEVDISIRPEVRKMAKVGIAEIYEFEQAVIKRYLAGKIETPKITSSEETPVEKETKIKNLADARKSLREAFGIK